MALPVITFCFKCHALYTRLFVHFHFLQCFYLVFPRKYYTNLGLASLFLHKLSQRELVIIVQGIVTAPILFALEEYPQLRELIDRGFTNTEDVDTVSVQISMIKYFTFFPSYMMRT